MYSTQGGHQLLMPSNIALHPAGMNQAGAIQVIAAGKPFQPNQLTSHMLTQGKQVLTQGQPSECSYLTLINMLTVFTGISHSRKRNKIHKTDNF